MFVLTQIKYHLFRHIGRSILALCAASFLFGGMVFYMWNIESNQKALDTLADNIPVTATVVNRNGSKKSGLFIATDMFDELCSAGVVDMLATAEVTGAWDESVRKQEFFYGGDVSMTAINNIRAWEGVEKYELEWMAGMDASIFETDRALCVLSEDSAQRFGAELGSEVNLAVYAVHRNSVGVTYTLISDATLEVAGIYHKSESGPATDKDMYIPTAWMRSTAEQNDVDFSYDSATCRIDPQNLNEFKAMLPKIGFMVPFDGANGLFSGDAITVDDELFIKTMRHLRTNLSTFQRFLIPFYLLIDSIVILITFLMQRGSRYDMAIASSLGQSKFQTAFVNFAGTFLTYCAGCVVIVPGAVLLAGVPLADILAICGIFLLCAAIGIAVALVMLLRFDTLALLTETD